MNVKGTSAKLCLIDRVKETPDSFTYMFSPATGSQRLSFTVGQFVTITALLKRPTPTASIMEESTVQRTSSSPNRDLIELTIKCARKRE